MKHKKLFAALLCAVSSIAHAASDSLDEVVVTAARNEQSISQTLLDTSVITQQKIAASGAADVPALLRNLAGVEVLQTGGVGAQSSLFLRGTNSTHTLVLLDGMRIGSATSGATALDQLMLDQIERIEVVRGNVSSLYGSEAIGGVIQIFTKHGKGVPAFGASAGYGTHATRRANASFGGEMNDVNFHLGVSRFATDGVSALDPALSPSANPDADGYTNTSLSARAGYAFNPAHRIEAAVFRSLGKVQTDNAYGLPTDRDENEATLSKWLLVSSNRLMDEWQSKLTLGQGADDLVNRSNGTQTSQYKTLSDQLAWQNILNVGGQGVVLLGAERLKQKVSSTTAFSVDARSTNSVLAGYTADYGVHQVQVNVRQDRYSDFGSANTGLLGYGVYVGDTLRLTANVSTAFKAPTFNDMYWPLAWGFQGNPNLKPERARNLEVGAHYRQGGQHLDAALFQNRIHDLISINSTWTTVENLDEAVIEGMELVYGVRQDGLEIENALTLQSPRNAKTGVQLPRRAQTLNTLTVVRRFEDGRVGFEWRSSGARSDGFNSLAAYDVINLSAQWKFAPRLDLTARVDNLFNQNYMLAYGYNTLGRTIWVGVNYR
ncbi:MAG: TonB-dependent receptor [Sideroxyarcus sp.]|nr:TonB-dependent receptor [Sideroxyarcus sp.]